jgi:hypothetical protein
VLHLCRPRPEQLAPIVQAAKDAGHDLTAAATTASISALQASAAAAAAAPSFEVQQQQLLTHYAQAAALAEGWCARAAALTEQLKALARGHGLTSDTLAPAVGPVRRPGSPAVAYLTNPQVAAAVASARAHIEQLGALLVQADVEVEALTEASKAYCLCQALYDEVRPMIGCDYCSDWFHWECVGLQPPREDQDHTEVAPPDFK